MKYQTQTGRSIHQAFTEFHKDNPKVYQMFTEQVLRAVRRKRSRISSKAIINWIRWEVSLDVKSTDGYKINDAFTAHYSRLFIQEYPEYTDMFEFRELRDGSEGEKPLSNDPFEMLVMNALLAGGHIAFYTDVQAASLIPRKRKGKKIEPQKLTLLFFERLKRKKLIKLISTELFSQRWEAVEKVNSQQSTVHSKTNRKKVPVGSTSKKSKQKVRKKKK